MPTIKRKTRRTPTQRTRNTSQPFSIESLVPLQVLIPVLALLLLGVSLLLFLFVIQRSADTRSQAAFFNRLFQQNQLGYQLLSHWSMDLEDTGVIASFGPTDLRSTGSPTTADGMMGSATRTRPGSYLESVGTIMIPSSSVTVGGWFTVLSTGEAPLVSLRSEDGEILSLIAVRGGTNRLVVRSSNGEFALPVTAQDLSGPFFASVSVDGENGMVRLRLNGTTSSSTLSEFFTGGRYALQVGRDFLRGQSGTIQVDTVSLWERALGENETALMFNNGEGQQYPFPTVQLSF